MQLRPLTTGRDVGHPRCSVRRQGASAQLSPTLSSTQVADSVGQAGHQGSLERPTPDRGDRQRARYYDESMGIVKSLRDIWRAFRSSSSSARSAGTSERIDNIAAASRDYGVSYFSGEVDELGSAGGGYRRARDPGATHLLGK